MRRFLIKCLSFPVYVADRCFDLAMSVWYFGTEKTDRSRGEYLEYRLLSETHKIEKGFSLPNFRKNASKNVREKLKKWIQFHLVSPYLSERASVLIPPLAPDDLKPSMLCKPDFKFRSAAEVITKRRSIRNFKQQNIDERVLRKIIEVASNSPSACNRQPSRVHIYTDPSKISQLLKHQNGNRGFSQVIPCLLVITFDRKAYFTSSERNLGYIDGALFSMNVVYAALDYGIASCMLNLSNYLYKDILLSKAAGIPLSEAPVMMIALGFPDDSAIALIPCRRPFEQIYNLHS